MQINLPKAKAAKELPQVFLHCSVLHKYLFIFSLSGAAEGIEDRLCTDLPPLLPGNLVS